MKLFIYGFFMAWGMFLWIPCPFPKWNERARGHMLACLPFIGCIVGGLWALAAWALGLFACPPAIYALILACVPWCVTGFIHLDGFMDVCDAVLSRRDIEERRRILKDPHCGAFAVICLVLLVLTSFCVFFSADGEVSLLPLAMIPVATRACAGLAVMCLRPLETSQYAGSERRGTSLVILPAIMLCIACALPVILYGTGGLAPTAAALGYWLLALYGVKKLGGISGDISGFALVCGELAGAAVLIFVR